ncbi:LIM and calponin homology domains-containing protein 1 isoform X1 [Vulpes lagopus]|uniref:LIM and calponin homology domains-containing protein 1 isoform X1 n=2 Tax=Vulpes lagopus TaxID=494514 RepID=UPI001BC9A37F|nr:LIM and calponin homology domains-containing protein 1 isoform X1 [Vulpes lagopus]
MACPALGLEALQPLQPEPLPEPAFCEAQKWIEQVTGRSFGDRDFRTGLENGILLCELLNAIKPGLVKKINRLPTPIAGLDNIILFLRGCKELGLRESQLFDPSDLQDTSNRVTVKSLDYSRKLKNVLVTIYWLGKAANSSASYSGTTLNLKEFEGLLAQMRKETDDIESPKRSIRDSGYIDCWDSERSDSLSPPRHGRDDSFDSLDSFGSRSRQTPSPDVVLRGSSDGRGSDSESDLPHRKLPDVKKDDMSARRTSHGEPKSAVPFNQYLPNKSNQTAYVPAPLRRRKAEREEYRKSWSTATSPLGGDRPCSYPETIEEEGSEVGSPCDEDPAGQAQPGGKPCGGGSGRPAGRGTEQPPPGGPTAAPAPQSEDRDAVEVQKRRRLEQAGIRVRPAAQRFASHKPSSSGEEAVQDTVLRKDNPSPTHLRGKGLESGDDVARRRPDPEKDDFAVRRARMNQTKPRVPLNQLLYGPYPKREAEKSDGREECSKGISEKNRLEDKRYGPRTPVSDDAESSSLLDMRCEEEAAVQPHSRARQEQLQLINSHLREEDDKWQDDLARWKSRRRSASQDLIKKEEERKKMEKLLAGEDGTSERRKSIKTYREIVQEKERRERELHEAYKNARSQEEAEGILQQYIERFTISEAVLERLEMPKILERSHSTEPNLTPFLNDPNPMKYLRRQSLPPPKFTATVETTIARTSVLDTGVSAGGGSPSKTVPPKAVPMLTPKPYSQPKNSQDVLKTFKVDGKVSMNGEAVHGDKEKERECPTVAPAPSLTKPQMFEGVARVHGSPVELKQDNNSIEINIKKPSSVPQELRATTEETEPNSQEDENDGGKTQKGNTELAPSEPQHFTTTVTRSSPTVPFVEFPSSPQRRNDVPPEEDQKKLGNEMSGKVELVLSQKVVKPKSPEPEATLTYPFLEKISETNQLHLPNLISQDPLLGACSHYSQTSFGTGELGPPGSSPPFSRFSVCSVVPSAPGSPGAASFPLRVQNSWRRSQFFSQSVDSPGSEKSPVTTPFKFWAWDPEEERRRQEKWQQEQERLLQERYQKEQNKLKEEWEKAQKEVEEEERRYYEEERKIIEDTVVPFTLSSSSADQLSTSSSVTEGTGTVSKMDLENCREEEQETKQKKPLRGDDSDLMPKAREDHPLEGKGSLTQGALAPSKNPGSKGVHQDHQLDAETGALCCRMNSQLAQDPPQNPQVSNPPMHVLEDVKPKTLPLDKSINHQIESPSERRKKSPRENFQAGHLSPCSPTPPGQSPNRSISGKKLCSSCGLPLGRGAAMIIETLQLYFHIQCFRCGLCKGQLGDAVSGTDVRIRSGLLNCNDCYLRSRSAGQPTTL